MGAAFGSLSLPSVIYLSVLKKDPQNGAATPVATGRSRRTLTVSDPPCAGREHIKDCGVSQIVACRGEYLGVATDAAFSMQNWDQENAAGGGTV